MLCAVALSSSIKRTLMIVPLAFHPAPLPDAEGFARIPSN
jgi:hypothetical protein